MSSDLPFETWKRLLQKDCERLDKIAAFNAMGDAALKLFWNDGVEPTVEGLLGYNQPQYKLAS